MEHLLTPPLILLGSVKAAVYQENTTLKAIRQEQGEFVDCSRHAAMLLESAAEKRVIANALSAQQLRQALQKEITQQDALLYLLSSLDSVLSHTTRRLAMQLFMQTSAVAQNFAQNRVLSLPPSHTLPLTECETLAASLDEPASRQLQAFYRELTCCLPHIASVHRCVQQVLYFDCPNLTVAPDEAFRDCVDAGLVAALVRAVAHQAKAELHNLLFSVNTQPKVMALFAGRSTHFAHQLIKACTGLITQSPMTALPVLIPSTAQEETAVDAPISTEASEDPILAAAETALQRRRKHREKHDYVRAESADSGRRAAEQRKTHLLKLLQQGKFNQCEQAVLELIEQQAMRGQTKHLAMSLCDVAQTMNTYGQYPLALRTYQAAQHIRPKDPFPFTGYAETLRQMGELAEAKAAYAEAKSRFPHEPFPFTRYAETLRQMGKLVEAKTAYAEAKSRFPHEPVPFNGYAETLRQMGELAEAKAAYAEAKSRFPHDPVPFTGYAETLRQMGELAEAKAAYAEAKSRFPHDPVPFTGYAETLRQMGELAEAKTTYAEAKSRFPHDPVPFNGYAETLRQMGELAEAKAAYAEAKSRFPHEPVPFNGYAETLRQMGELAEAKAAYAEAKKMFATNPVSFNGYAETLRQMGELAEAKAAYAETKSRFPHEPVPFNGYAETLRQMGELAEAKAAYAEAKKMFATNPVSFNGYAETLRQLGKLVEAKAAYSEAKKMFATNSVPFNGYAETLRQMGELVEAKAAYAEAKSRFPHDPVPFTGYAETLRQMGKLAEAKAAYAEAKSLFPHDPVPFTGYAETLRDLGELDLAWEAYQFVLDRFPQDRVAKNALACLALEQGRTDDLAQYLLCPAVCQTVHDWWDYHVHAMAALRRGGWEEARQMLEFGANNTPFWQSREVFATTLNWLRLRHGETVALPEKPAAISSAQIIQFPLRAIVNAHIAGKQHATALGKAWLQTVQGSAQAKVIALVQHLNTYLHATPETTKTDELEQTIFEEEFALLLRAA